jgi:uncharacterized protein
VEKFMYVHAQNFLFPWSLFVILALFLNSCSDALDAENKTGHPDWPAPVSEMVNFENDGVTFAGKFTFPDTDGVYPFVVFVHGSEQVSALATYSTPQRLAKRGVASFIYDKRGTGGSGGEQTVNLSVLARDVSAAVDFALSHERVNNVGLIAFSQGGWTAPLAANQNDKVSFLVIDSGSAVSAKQQDHWALTIWMQNKGFDDAALADAEPVIQAAYNTLECAFQCGWEELEAIRNENAGEDWLPVLAESPTNVGFILGSTQEELLQTIEALGADVFEGFTRDPLPAIQALTAPSLWLYGDNDPDVPAQKSAERIRSLKQQGRPVEVFYYKNIGHGVLPHLFADSASEDDLQTIFDFIETHSGQ